MEHKLPLGQATNAPTVGEARVRGGSRDRSYGLRTGQKTVSARGLGGLSAVFVAMASLTVPGGPAMAQKAPVEVVFWHQETPPNRVQRYQEIIDKFNAANPNIRVRQEVQDWATIYTVAPAAIGSGTGPDILMVMPELGTYVRATSAVQPVTQFVKELDATHHFLPAATDPYHDKGEFWGVPLWGMVQLLWYRKDIFQTAGIKAPPATWEEVQDVAAKLTKDKRFGITLPASKTTATDQTFFSFLKTHKGEDLFDEKGKIIFDNPNSVRAVDTYTKLLKYAAPDSTNYAWGEPEAAFNNGSAAMLIDKGIMLSIFLKDSGAPAEALGCAPIPQPATNGQPGSHYASNAAMILTKDRAKQEAAKQFIKYLLQPDVYGPLLNAEPGLFLPVTGDGFTLKSWLSEPALNRWPECTKLLAEQSKSGGLYGFTSGRYQINIGPIAGQNIIAQVIQKVAIDKMSPAEAVKWGQKAMEAAIQ